MIEKCSGWIFGACGLEIAAAHPLRSHTTHHIEARVFVIAGDADATSGKVGRVAENVCRQVEADGVIASDDGVAHHFRTGHGSHEKVALIHASTKAAVVVGRFDRYSAAV